MASDERAVVFHASVAFDGRSNQSPGQSHGRGGRGQGGGLPDGKRNRPAQQRGHHRGAGHAAEKAFPGARRAHFRSDGPAAQEAAPGVLQHVGQLDHQHEEKQQPGAFFVHLGPDDRGSGTSDRGCRLSRQGVFPVRTAQGTGLSQGGRLLRRRLRLGRKPPGEQRRGEAQAIDADHQPHLDLGHPFQVVLVISGHGNADSQEQKRPHRDQDAVKLVAIQGHGDVLRRGKDEKHPEQRPVVAAPGGGQRDVFLKRPQRHQPEQPHGPVTA